MHVVGRARRRRFDVVWAKLLGRSLGMELTAEGDYVEALGMMR